MPQPGKILNFGPLLHKKIRSFDTKKLKKLHFPICCSPAVQIGAAGAKNVEFMEFENME